MTYQIMDLTHRLLPGEEQYTVEIKPRGAPRTAPTGDIMHNVCLWSHSGTHVEVSRHFYAEGKDTSDFPPDTFVGPAVRLDFRRKEKNEPITLDDLRAAGGLEPPHCIQVVRAGATSLPLSAALHREADMAAFIAHLRVQCEGTAGTGLPVPLDEAARLAGEGQERGPAPAFKILVTSRSFGQNDPEIIEQMRAAGCLFLPLETNPPPTEEAVIACIGEADALIAGTEPVTARVMDAAPRLKVIARQGVGYDNVDLDAARARGIPVCVAAGIADTVADMAMGLLLALARQIPQGNASVRAGEWRRFTGPELRDKTLGIVGLGQIGRAVCRRAKGFGLRVVANDTYPDADFAAAWGVEYLSLDDLLAQSDFVSLHAPVLLETRGLINAARLARMKPTAYLINTARGELVEEAALYDALKEGRIAGAASDVFVREPPGENPLLTLDNFIAMPHSGGQTPEAQRRMGRITAENVLRVLRGEEPLHRVE
jgi:D-3-phosphoglycerate dehydrogenase